MIRRATSDELLLITQEDHAQLAGRLTEQWGNATFPAPESLADLLAAVESHDAGWSLHDGKPILNEQHLPAAFYEMPMESYVRIWVASVAASSAKGGPLGGLLVSLHFSGLASMIPADQQNESVQWLVSDFITCQKQRQRDYCSALGLSLALNNGTVHGQSEKDESFLYNFRVLRLVDWISLILCAGELPEFMQSWRDTLLSNVKHEHTAPAIDTQAIEYRWSDPYTLQWSPWPLKSREFIYTLPASIVPKGEYRHVRDLQRVYDTAERRDLTLKLIPLE